MQEDNRVVVIAMLAATVIIASPLMQLGNHSSLEYFFYVTVLGSLVGFQVYYVLKLGLDKKTKYMIAITVYVVESLYILSYTKRFTSDLAATLLSPITLLVILSVLEEMKHGNTDTR